MKADRGILRLRLRMTTSKVGVGKQVGEQETIMAMVTLQPTTSREATAAAEPAAKDPFAGMTLLTAEGQAPRAKAAIEITKNALKRIRVAMAKEGVSPEQGGLRVGIQGGG